MAYLDDDKFHFNSEVSVFYCNKQYKAAMNKELVWESTVCSLWSSDVGWSSGGQHSIKQSFKQYHWWVLILTLLRVSKAQREDTDAAAELFWACLCMWKEDSANHSCIKRKNSFKTVAPLQQWYHNLIADSCGSSTI